MNNQDLMYRDAENVEEVLTQGPMDGEVVVKITEHLAFRVYVENGTRYLETVCFMGKEPIHVIAPLTEGQAGKLAAALFDEGK